MNTTYDSTETSDAVIQQGLDSVTNWLAREALTGVITVIVVLIVISTLVKLLKSAAAATAARAKEMADEQMARIRYEETMAERDRIAQNVKERLRRVREENKMVGREGDIKIPVVSLQDMIDPIVGNITIPTLTLDSLVDNIKIDGMEDYSSRPRKNRNVNSVNQ